ncbi:MAG TPA: tetratricopeptide repeat protein, partial [Polyangiaceae bacterium]|nr:tetratricopeptide repeat protein [Polyangiaceae bacterium]
LIARAETRLENQQPIEATKLYRECLDKAGTTGNTKERMGCACGLGNSLLMEAAEGAAPAFEDCLALANDLAAANFGGDALRGLGAIAALGGDTKVAERRYEDARHRYAQAHQPSGEGQALVGLGRALHKQGRNEEARSALGNALSRFSSLAKPAPYLGDVEEALGDLDLTEGKAEQARKHYDSARNHFLTAGNVLGNANITLQLAELERQASAYEASRKLFDDALALYGEVGEDLGRANALRGIADLELSQGELEFARQKYAQARDIFLAQHSPGGEGHALLGLGNVALAGADKPLARQHYDDARSVFDAANDLSGTADALCALAEIDPSDDSAIKLYEQARTRAHNARNAFAECNALVGLARRHEPKPALATKYLADAERVCQDAGNLPGRAHVALLTGKLTGESDGTAARRHYDAARALFAQIGDLTGEANVLLELAVLDASEGEHEQAAKHFEEARADYQRSGDSLGEFNVDITEAQYLTALGRRGDAKRLLERTAEWASKRGVVQLAGAARRQMAELGLR